MPGSYKRSFLRTHLRKSSSCNLGSNNGQWRYGNSMQLSVRKRTRGKRGTYVSQLVVALVSVAYEVVVSLLKLSARLIGSLMR